MGPVSAPAHLIAERTVVRTAEKHVQAVASWDAVWFAKEAAKTDASAAVAHNVKPTAQWSAASTSALMQFCNL